jgi:hypothetical protein
VWNVFPALGPATAFLSSMVCGFLAAACVFKLVLNLLTVAAGDSFNMSADDKGGPYWAWPRDRLKIAAQSFALVIAAVLFLGLTYVLARRAFG